MIIIYMNVWQCLIINQDNIMNQHSKYGKIGNKTLYQTGRDLCLNNFSTPTFF